MLKTILDWMKSMEKSYISNEKTFVQFLSVLSDVTIHFINGLRI